MLARLGKILVVIFTLCFVLTLNSYASESNNNRTLQRLAPKNTPFDFAIYDQGAKKDIQPVYRSDGTYEIKWRYNISFSDMVVNDKFIFLLDNYGVLRQIDFNGNLKEAKILDIFGFTSLIKGLDGTIYLVDQGDQDITEGSIHAFNPDGTLKWEIKITKPSFETINCCCGDGQGNFYLLTQDGILAYDDKGSLKWVNKGIVVVIDDDLNSTNISSLDVNTNGNIYLKTYDRGFICVDQNGKVKWERPDDSDYDLINLDKDLIYRNDEKIMALDAETGSVLYEKDFSQKKQEFQTCGDWSDGVYINYPGKVISFDTDGEIEWLYKMPFSAYTIIDGQPMTDKNGNVYFKDYGSNLYILDKNGNEHFIILQKSLDSIYSKLFVPNQENILFASETLGLLSIGKQEIKVFVGDDRAQFEVPPRIINGKTMVPFRQIFEKLGMDIKWDKNTQTITGENDKSSIYLKVGSNMANVNGKGYKLDINPRIINGTTFVPLRFIGESSQLSVTWNSYTRSIYIGTEDQQILSTIKSYINYLNKMDVLGEESLLDHTLDPSEISYFNKFYSSSSSFVQCDDIQITERQENEAKVKVNCNVNLLSGQGKNEGKFIWLYNMTKTKDGTWKISSIESSQI